MSVNRQESATLKTQAKNIQMNEIFYHAGEPYRRVEGATIHEKDFITGESLETGNKFIFGRCTKVESWTPNK